LRDELGRKTVTWGSIGSYVKTPLDLIFLPHKEEEEKESHSFWQKKKELGKRTQPKTSV